MHVLREFKENPVMMRVSRAVAVSAAKQVAQAKRPGCGQAFPDLFDAEWSAGRQFGRRQGAGRGRFGQTFGKHLDLGGGHHWHGHDAFKHPTESIMKPERQGEHERVAPSHASDTTHRLAQGHLLRADNRHRLARERSFQHGGARQAHDVLYGVRSDQLITETDEGKYREGVKSVAQVV
jgi:hypothetical protein